MAKIARYARSLAIVRRLLAVRCCSLRSRHFHLRFAPLTRLQIFRQEMQAFSMTQGLQTRRTLCEIAAWF